MTRPLLAAAALFALAGCNARDDGNGSTVLSVDRNAVEAGLDEAGNAVGQAAGDVREAAQEAGPAIGNAAERTGAAAERAGERIDNAVDVPETSVNDNKTEQKR